MNPFNLSPAGLAFWGSIIRHMLTAMAGVLVTHGYVTKSGADAYEEELVGAIIYGAAAIWSNRVAYWQQIRQLVAGAMPGPAPAAAVDAKVAELHQANALPSVFTPSTVSPSLVKPMILLACVLGGAALSLSACASAPPAGTYSATGLKAFNADQLLKDITALSQTAINLNATQGKLHLKDSDTALIRDFALAAGAGLQAYANGSGTLGVVITAYQTLSAGLSTDAKLNESLKYALALVAGAISNIPVQ